MAITIREISRGEVGPLIPLLLLAEPSESALEWSLDHLSDALYRMDDSGEPVGVATMRWRGESPEIVELAIAKERHGERLGRQFIGWLLEEARRRGKREVLVGTANSSIGNIVFYQKCGFRMHEVRQDYFWYYPEPVYENGLRARDMLVFRYDLTRPAENG